MIWNIGTFVAIITAVVYAAWPHLPWRRKRRLPGGPEDGKGCLTEAQRETFAALAASFERESS